MNEISNTLRQSKVKGRRRSRFYKLKEIGWNRCTVQAFHSLRFLKIWRHFLPGPFWWKEKKILAIESHKGHPHLQCTLCSRTSYPDFSGQKGQVVEETGSE